LEERKALEVELQEMDLLYQRDLAALTSSNTIKVQASKRQMVRACCLLFASHHWSLITARCSLLSTAQHCSALLTARC
jgi:hypothetical protein